MDEFFWKLHENLPKQAPGDEKITKKILNSIDFPNSDLKILDIGCGSGFQSLVAAKLYPHSKIIALDLHKRLLDEFEQKIQSEDLSNRITIVQGSMDDMPFSHNSFDLILSEGSIYNIGFEKGLEYWRNFIKTDSYMAVSELCWIKEEKQKPIEKYWKKNYPGMLSLQENISIIERKKLKLISIYVFPAYAWFSNYYTPLEERIRFYKNQLSLSDSEKEILEEEEREISMYKQYADFYSYVYFLIQK
jgi:ubiquinone/menaquinone biosynthesis C-methylase UbiE